MKNRTFKIAGAVLAGGKCSRMKGKNKASLKISKIPIITRTLNLLDETFDEVMIITDSREKYSAYKKKYTIIEDKIKDIGPLGGIWSGLSESPDKAVFFCACDMPFLHNDLVQRMLSSFNETGSDAVVPKINDLIEPGVAVYRTELKGRLFDFINSSRHYSIRNFLKSINVHYMDLENNRFNRNMFKNINTIKDWKEVMRKTGGCS